VRIVQALAKYYGFKTLFVFQPVLILKKPLSVEEKKMKISFNNCYPKGYQWFTKNYLCYAELMEKELGKGGIPFLNLVNVFKKDTNERYIDNVHMDGKAYRIIAKKIVGAIQKLSVSEK
jgi:lysophospholipase L1-like esterase